MRRVVSWAGFACIACVFLPRLPPGWQGAIVALLVVFVFAPRD